MKIITGNLNGKDIDLVSVFEGIGKWNHGDKDQAEEVKLTRNAPGPWWLWWYVHCQHRRLIEVLGLSLPGSSSSPC